MEEEEEEEEEEEGRPQESPDGCGYLMDPPGSSSMGDFMPL
jgi:hypothetical protein